MRTEERSGASSPSFSSKRRRRERDWLPGLVSEYAGAVGRRRISRDAG